MKAKRKRVRKKPEAAGKYSSRPPINLPQPPRHIPFHTRAMVKKNEIEGTGLFFVAMGLGVVFFFIIPMRFLSFYHLFRADRITEGQITGIRAESASDNDLPVYKYIFRFMATDGKEYIQYSYATGLKYDVDEKVTIKYVESNPRLSVIEGSRFSLFDPDNPALYMPFLILIIGYIMIGYDKPGKMLFIFLLRWGTITEGKITRKMRILGKYYFDYQYMDDNQNSRKGRYKTGDSNFSETGRDVPVIYVNKKRLYYSRIVDTPLVCKDGVWELDFDEPDQKKAVIFALLRSIAWIGLLIMIIMVLKEVFIGV